MDLVQTVRGSRLPFLGQSCEAPVRLAPPDRFDAAFGPFRLAGHAQCMRAEPRQTAPRFDLVPWRVAAIIAVLALLGACCWGC
jgi:hypothetical protein